MHVRKRILGALLGAIAAAAAAAVMAVPGPGAGRSDGLCLQPTSSDPNVPVIQTQCHPGLDLQDWLFVQLGSGPTYTFVNQASGIECLWAFGNGDAGAPVGVEPCRNPPASNEQFNSGLTLPDSVFLESLIGFHHTGECITVPPGAGDGTQMQIRPCSPPNVPAEDWDVR